jgi:hypothetical protein
VKCRRVFFLVLAVSQIPKEFSYRQNVLHY